MEGWQDAYIVWRKDLAYEARIMQLLKGANKSKISRVAGRCDRDASQTFITEVEGLPDSYCCQGCQDGPKSPQSLSSNCEKGLLVGCVLQTGPFGSHSKNSSMRVPPGIEGCMIRKVTDLQNSHVLPSDLIRDETFYEVPNI